MSQIFQFNNRPVWQSIGSYKKFAGVAGPQGGEGEEKSRASAGQRILVAGKDVEDANRTAPRGSYIDLTA